MYRAHSTFGSRIITYVQRRHDMQEQYSGEGTGRYGEGGSGNQAQGEATTKQFRYQKHALNYKHAEITVATWNVEGLTASKLV